VRTLAVRLVLVVLGVLTLPVSALVLDGVDDSGWLILAGAVALVVALGVVIGRWGLDPLMVARDRAVAGVLWAALGLALGIGVFYLALSSIGS
jgi:hypothetical protein